MSTSLADQLKRLATPQTTQLVDSKKRASILFDVREAANKDRETIFDIGRSGLLELTSLNPTFLQFEQTLFSRTARDLVRNIENAEANRDLNKTIRKFLHHLSPHFLLQPAHKCLEWLIRRFHIHEYNIDDFMMLILPYHETRMFVKCVQIMPLRDEKSPWHWLNVIQKPGIVLSKQVLFNRAATDRFLIKFVCKSTYEAVRELDMRAYTLQAMFAFYCTTILGAMDTAAEITDDHISSIYSSVSKGLTSSVVDFCAASMMITGQLVVKAKLTKKFLDTIVLKLARNQHPGLQSEAVVLLVLIFQTQEDSLCSGLSDEALDLITRSKWIPSALSKNYVDGIHILPLYLPLLSGCLKNVQLKEREWKASMIFCESLLNEVIFKDVDAGPVIRSILHAYVLRDKQENNVITLDSDDENEIELTDENLDVNNWYSDLLKSLDRQYPVVFDKVTKDILKELDSNSNSKRKSLKTVLGFLFTAACSDGGANIFENLYHYSAENRIEAMRYLVKNMRKLCFSDDSKNLLRDSIAERLTDDSLLVVTEALKFSTDDLVQMLDRKLLAEKLLYILSRCIHDHVNTYAQTTVMAIQHVASSKVWTEENVEEIFLAVWPFLLGMTQRDGTIVEAIINSDLAQKFSFLRKCDFNTEDPFESNDHVLKLLKNRKGLPDICRIIAAIQNIPEKRLTTVRAYFNVLLLSQILPDQCPADIARDVLNLVFKFSEQFKHRLVVAAEFPNSFMSTAFENNFPIQMNLMCIDNLIDAIGGAGLTQGAVNFSEQSDGLSLVLKIFEILVSGVWHSKDEWSALYNRALRNFVDTVVPSIDDKVEFFSNFFIGHAVVDIKASPAFVPITNELQIKAIRVFNAVLLKSPTDVNITLNALIRIISGLASPQQTIRTCTIETLNILVNLETLPPTYLLLIQKLLKRHEELELDDTQLSLILYRIFCSSKSSQKQLKPLLDDLFECVTDQSSSTLVRATILEMLKHINTVVYLKRIAGAPLEILKTAGLAAGPEPSLLNRYESQIIRSVLFRFNDETVKSTASYCCDIIVQCLHNHKLLLAYSDDVAVAVPIIAIDTITVPVFGLLLLRQKTQLIQEVIRLTAVSQNIDVLHAATKLMRRIDIDAKAHLDIFVAMRTVDIKGIAQKPGKNRAEQALSTDIIGTTEWRCGIAMLEYLQNKRNLKNAHLLIPDLFAVLKRCLKFEDQSLVEYTKQLVLACMLHCCQLISPDGQAKRELLPDKVFEIELVVQCIRGTQNPQTHHHALQLLSHTAAMIPESVLHNMMNIFTFVGSSVVRRDDAYTYQIIANIIKSIIPTLINSNRSLNDAQQDEAVIPVLRVFADIILDVPEHRRLRLYEDLLNTLDPQKYTWMFLAVLFESHVRNFSKSVNRDDPVQLKRIDVAIEITNLFDCGIVLETCTRLIDFLHKQPTEKSSDSDSSKMDIDITDTNIFNVPNYSNYQLRHFKYTTLQFIIRLTERTSQFVTKVASITPLETAALKTHFKHIIVTVLQFIGKVVKLAAAAEEKFWKIVLTNCYDILDHVLALIYPDMLLQVVSGLLNKNNIPEVRRKAIELLNKKLQLEDFFATCEQSTLLGLLDPLYNIIESTIDEEKLVKNATTSENVSLQQQSLIAVKLLSMHLAKDHSDAFKPVLDILSAMVKKGEAIPMNVLAQSMLCLAEICSNLRAHAISHLSKFMPAIGRILQSQIKNANTTPNIILYILTAVYKIVETLPLFLSPYLVNLIVSLSQIWAKLLDQTSTDAQRKLSKLDAIWKKLATVLTLRILIPMIDQSYKKCIEEPDTIAAVGPLMKLLAESLSHLSGTEIQPYQHDLGTFFVLALQFRSENELDAAAMDAQEDHIINAFVGMVLKLSESSFRPLYYKIYDWAIRGDTSVDRAITFYRLSSRIAESLKSLFVLFASDFLQNAADLLRQCIRTDDAPPAYSSDVKCSSLVSSIVRTLHFVFMHDSQGFITGDRFELLLLPIVDQLTNNLVRTNSTIKDQIPACLAQLAVAVNDDTMWKQLNYQILLKTRNPNSQIRLFAISSCVEIAKKLGNDFLPLLPETIPFFAEMLEDENVDVEKACQASVQELERVLGEPLQKYF